MMLELHESRADSDLVLQSYPLIKNSQRVYLKLLSLRCTFSENIYPKLLKDTNGNQILIFFKTEPEFFLCGFF